MKQQKVDIATVCLVKQNTTVYSSDVVDRTGLSRAMRWPLLLFNQSTTPTNKTFAYTGRSVPTTLLVQHLANVKSNLNFTQSKKQMETLKPNVCVLSTSNAEVIDMLNFSGRSDYNNNYQSVMSCASSVNNTVESSTLLSSVGIYQVFQYCDVKEPK